MGVDVRQLRAVIIAETGELIQNLLRGDQKFDESAAKAEAAGERIEEAIKSATEAAKQNVDVNKRLSEAIQQAALKYEAVTGKTVQARTSATALGQAYHTLTEAQKQQVQVLTEITSKTDAVIALQKAEAQAAEAASHLSERMEAAGARLSATVTVPLVALGKRAADVAIRLDSLRLGLTAITGSADEAGRQFDRLQELAKLPGLGMEEVAQGSINLQAAGFSAQEAEAAIKSFGNALALVGRGRADLVEVVRQLQQIASTGKITQEDLRPIAARVPQVRAAMLAAFGTSSTELLSKMGLDSKVFVDRLVKELARLPTASDSIRNSMENIQDSADRSLARLGTSVLRVVTGPLQQAADAADSLTKQFATLPASTQDLITGFGGIAAATGPLLLATSQIGKMKEAIIAARLALSGPVGLTAAIALLVGLLAKAGLDQWAENSNKNIKAMEQNAIPAIKARNAELRAALGPLGQYIALEERAQAFGSSKLFTPTRTDNLEGLKAAGVTFNDQGQAEAAGGRLAQVRGYYVQLEDEMKRGEKSIASLTAKLASEAKTQKAPKPIVPIYDIEATQKLQGLIASLRENVATFGDKSEYAKVHFQMLSKEFKNADPSVKAVAESLAKQLDGLTANAEAAKKAKEHLEHYTSALRDMRKERQLATVRDDDPHREEKRFKIEQQFADPKEKLTPAEVKNILPVIQQMDAERETREGATDATKRQKDAYKELEGAVQSLTAKNASLASGSEHLTHVQEAERLITKLQIDANSGYGNSLIERLRTQAALADAQEDAAKSWDDWYAALDKYEKGVQSLQDELTGIVDAYNQASKTGSVYETTLDRLADKYRDVLEAGDGYQRFMVQGWIELAAQTAQDTDIAKQTERFTDALADVKERLAEATGHGDAYTKVLARMRLTSKELTPEQADLARQIAEATKQLEHFEKRRREVANIAGQLSSPFRDAFDEMFQKGGKAGIQRFTQEMKSSLSGMFADLLGNQVKNALTAMLTPLYDDLTAMLKSSINSLQDALSSMHLSVNQIAATVYGLLAAVGAQGKKRQKGALIGGLIGGIAGSFLPGGWLLGAQIGSSLGGAISGGNTGEIALAGINAAGAYGNIGGGAINATQNNAGGTSHGSILNGRGVNVTTNFHGPVNNLGGAELIQSTITSGVRAGLRTTRG